LVEFLATLSLRDIREMIVARARRVSLYSLGCEQLETLRPLSAPCSRSRLQPDQHDLSSTRGTK
jgi:hypothetical protein